MDWKKIGLRCGIEIHQQLVGKKLFCDCPTHISEDDESHIEVKRKLRAVIGETGKIDAAAAQEQARDKTYIYRAYQDTTCLVELDEEPPHSMNKDGLYTTLQIASLLNANIVDEVQVMRKTVVDGSNTTGFQRTALVARNGILKSSKGDVRVPMISLEEDAAKIISRNSNEDTYNLSRLGIPLVEIGTDPDIVSPEHAKEVAAKLGMLLRSTGRVKRGLGTIRQDVNVSIKGGNRVEVKGAQDLAMIPTLVEVEAKRQIKILELKDKLTTTVTKYIGVSDVFKKTECKFIAKSLKDGKEVAAVPLPKMNGLLGIELQPGKRVGSDLSDYAKVRSGIGGIIHSDEDFKKYNFTDKEISSITKLLKLGKNDAFAMIVGTKEQCTNGFIAIFMRLKMLAKGVPMEVRKANEDGTTSYLRPMPGAARMYPETDTLPVDARNIKIELPELIVDKVTRYQKKMKLGLDLAELIAKGQNWQLFDNLTKKFPSLKAASIAETIESVPVQLKRKHNIIADINEDDWITLLTATKAGKFTLNNAVDLFVKAQKTSVEEALKGFQMMSVKDVEKIVKKVVSSNKDAPFGMLMGMVMKESKGQADGKVVSELVKKYLK
jgi:glutamyl-tRNA(Gln) amidotransferase subunit E